MLGRLLCAKVLDEGIARGGIGGIDGHADLVARGDGQIGFKVGGIAGSPLVPRLVGVKLSANKWALKSGSLGCIFF